MQFTSQRRGVRVPIAVTLSLIAPVLGSVGAARAQQTAPVTQNERVVSLTLRDARLELAIQALSQQSGIDNFAFDPLPGHSFNLVNVHLTDIPLSQALKTIASSASAVLTYEDGVYHFRPRTEADLKPAEPKPVVQTVAAVQAPVSRTLRTQWTKIQLNFLLPSDFVRTLSDPTYLPMINSIAPEPAKPPTPDNSANGLVHQLINAPTLGSGATNAPTAAPANVPVGTAGSAGRDDSYSQAGAQGFGRNGGFGAQGGQFGGAPGGNPNGPGGAPGQGGGQASLRPPGITNLISNDADNALIVEYDNVEDLNRLREIVRLLDVKPKQVQIKAEFVAVNVGDADSFGIDWHFQPSNNTDVYIPPSASGTGTPSILMAYASGVAVANMRAALTRSTTNVLQAPLISTVNNRPAVIQVSTTVSIAQQVVIPVTNGSPVTASQQIPVTAVNGLSVTPHINGDNSISLVLQPTLQSVTLRGDGGYDATTNSLTTSRIVQNGETMVLGGFITKNQQQTLQKVPILSDLPIIGNLFTQRSSSVTGTETLVFVTPTIIEDQSQGVVGTGGGAPAPTP